MPRDRCRDLTLSRAASDSGERRLPACNCRQLCRQYSCSPDHGTPHVAASWGGTAFNWMANRSAYITPDRPERFWFETYSASARRFKDIAASAGADVLISNHTIFDGSKTKIPALERRKPGDPHPYVIGKDSVQRYLTVVDEYAQAGLARTH